MIVFRSFLILICFTCASWAALVFFGPMAISSLVKSNTDGRFELSNVRVTPQLQIKVGRLDFAVDGGEKAEAFNGFSRSIKLNWSIFNDEPFLDLEIGPTFVNDVLTFKRARLFVPSFKSLNLSKIDFNASIKGIKLEAFGSSDAVNLNGTFDRKNYKISNLAYQLDSLFVDQVNSWLVSDLSGDLDDLDLREFLNSQALNTKFFAKKISNLHSDFMVLNLNGSLRVASSSSEILVKAETVSMPGREAKLRKVEAELEFGLENLLTQANLKVKDGLLPNGARISSLKSEIQTISIDSYSIQIQGVFEEQQLNISKTYMGSLPEAKFNADLNLDNSNSYLNGTTLVNFSNLNPTELKILFSLKTKPAQPVALSQCLVINCGFFDFDLDYDVMLEGNSLTGNSVCSKSPCDYKAFAHTLRTENTNKLFEKLNSTKILNPFLSLSLYGAISAGEKFGNGHEIKF